MISVNEIRNKAERWWNDNSFLSAMLKNEPFFPKHVQGIRLDKPADDLEALVRIKKEQDDIRQQSKSVIGYGYTLSWEKRKSRLIGENEFITGIYFANEIDYLKFIGKEKAYRLFLNDSHLIRNEFNELSSWITDNGLKIIEHAGDWNEILAVCRYFKNQHVPNKYYIRELPIEVDTKFIENHDSILKNLLDVLIPDTVNVQEKKFAKRYGLKYSQPLIRLRFLDLELHVIQEINDISVPLSEICLLQIPSLKHIFIAENLMNFLTIPQMAGSIAIWSGGGFNVDYFKCIDWMKNLSIFYWGDIDSHGLQILSQCRGYFPKTQALMMDMETLLHFKKQWGKDSENVSRNLPGLTTQEKELFDFVKNNKIRLEQEKIPQEFALSVFKQIQLTN